ncbi:UNVERIFIED_ORG: ABC-type transport system involved in cytochrome bd biosynthesis fused ATPase/permease subunit [Heyndrickxia coagulans]
MKLKLITGFLKKFFTNFLLNLHNILFLAGLFLIAFATFMFNTITGLIVTGLFLILIAFMLDKGRGEN